MAVSVTVWPTTTGFGWAFSVVLDETCTTCVSAPVLETYVGSPEYVAVIECDPNASAEVVSVALPPLTGTVPSGVEPSANVTVPVAAGEASVRRPWR